LIAARCLCRNCIFPSLQAISKLNVLYHISDRQPEIFPHGVCVQLLPSNQVSKNKIFSQVPQGDASRIAQKSDPIMSLYLHRFTQQHAFAHGLQFFAPFYISCRGLRRHDLHRVLMQIHSYKSVPSSKLDVPYKICSRPQFGFFRASEEDTAWCAHCACWLSCNVPVPPSRHRPRPRRRGIRVSKVNFSHFQARALFIHETRTVLTLDGSTPSLVFPRPVSSLLVGLEIANS
jgi:hypothetical protein